MDRLYIYSLINSILINLIYILKAFQKWFAFKMCSRSENMISLILFLLLELMIALRFYFGKKVVIVLNNNGLQNQCSVNSVEVVKRRYLFNPDHIHRGYSIERLKNIGKIEALENLLCTSFKKGLLNDTKDHEKRKSFFGCNKQISRISPSFWQISAKHFQDDLLRLLAAAGFVSLFLGILTEGLKWGWLEGFSIFFAVALVVFVSSVDDFMHERQFQMIKGESHQKTMKVYRGGKLYEMEASEIMVGDVIQIITNDRIFVDGILLQGEDLTIDESEITGEANQIKKRVPISYQRREGADPFILSSSTVIHGMGIMLVMAVGQNSYYGNQLTKIQQQHNQSPLKEKIADLSDSINDSSVVVGIITFTSILVHYFYHCLQKQNPLQYILSIQTLHQLVEAILVTFTIDVALPESLPLSMTLSLAHAVKQLHKNKIFVKHLNDAETMGGIDSLCITKTGFITKNMLSVTRIYVQDRNTNIITSQAMSEQTCRILNLAIIMSTAASPKFIEQTNKSLKVEQAGNKTECALLEMAYKMGYNYERFRINSRVKRIYSSGHSKRKMATVYRDQSGKLYLFVKGSTGFVLPYCSYYINKNEQIEMITPSVKANIHQAIISFGKESLRTITVAYKQVNSIPNKWNQVEKNLIMIAIFGIKDLVRKGVKPIIKQCKNKGINVRMLSNEGRYTAIGTAREAGIIDTNWVENDIDLAVIEGSDFRQLVGGLTKENPTERKIGLDNFNAIIDSLKIIYRASQTDKFLLSQGLRQNGHVVAFAGNGANDTQALRKADVSLSMNGTASSIAKEASDIVFLNDNFSSILTTIKWGRHTFQSVRKFLVMQLTINLVAAIMTLLGAVFLGQGPLHPLQMLWINLLIDILGSVALILQQPKQSQTKLPYSRRDKILTSDLIKQIGFQGVAQVVFLSFILFGGPHIFGVPSSVEVQQFSKTTAEHYSIFFHTFVLLQIFNQFNLRQLVIQRHNVFDGLLKNPLFLCFTITSFALQHLLMRYGGRFFHITELSLKTNLFCICIGSLSIFVNYISKVIIPDRLYFSKQKIQIGKFQWIIKPQEVQKEEEQDKGNGLFASDTNFQLMSLQFCTFLVKKKSKFKGYSYMEPLQTLKSQESESEKQQKNILDSIPYSQSIRQF